MAEVADYLVPTDGLTNSNLGLAGIDLIADGAIDVRFDFTDEGQNQLGTFTVEVSPERSGSTTDEMIAQAHRQMIDVLRQWIYSVDMMRQVYESRPARRTQ